MDLKRQFSSRYLSLQTKTELYKALLRPIIIYGCESWALIKMQKNKFRVFEKNHREIFLALY